MVPTHNSELAAAIALLLTCGDNEERAEVYGCAADRQQASIVFEVAKDMVTMCPALAKRVKILASQKRIVYLPTGSYYQVLSADVANKHGFADGILTRETGVPDGVLINSYQFSRRAVTNSLLSKLTKTEPKYPAEPLLQRLNLLKK